KKHQAEADAQGIQAVISSAAETKTKGRSVKAMETLIDTELEGRTVGVDPYELNKIADKIKDEELSARIYSQLPAALATGADVKLPLSALIARMEPETLNRLLPNLRARTTGLTREEAKGIEAKVPE